jgi:hypothetical protein
VNADKIEVMSPRRSKKPAPARKQSPVAELRRALSGQRKGELVDDLVELAQADRGVLRHLTSRFEVAATSAELVAATRRAIADATAFDPRDINRNFAYDYAAYEEIQRNLGRLVDAGHLRDALRLALELMEHGSHQVEMSDEGMMTKDIEECLVVVLQALQRCDLPEDEVTAWCRTMLAADRVGCIAREALQSLQRRFQVIPER